MLTIAVSSRSLFHLEEENRIFETDGQEAFDAHMLRLENEFLAPGIAFHLVRKMLALGRVSCDRNSPLVRVIVLSRNSPEAGVRIMRSIAHYGLPIETAVFTAGGNRYSYAKALDVDLFLSATAADSRHAIDNGIASATIAPRPAAEFLGDASDHNVRIAMDGDSVVFSGESDLLYQSHGLAAFIESESQNALIPLGEGPFKRLLTRLCELRLALATLGIPEGRLEVALVTARGLQSHGRVLTTLRAWGLCVDTMIFAGGMPKGPLLKGWNPDFFFDDAQPNVDSAASHNVAAGHVPFGVGGIPALPHSHAH